MISRGVSLLRTTGRCSEFPTGMVAWFRLGMEACTSALMAPNGVHLEAPNELRVFQGLPLGWFGGSKWM